MSKRRRWLGAAGLFLCVLGVCTWVVHGLLVSKVRARLEAAAAQRGLQAHCEDVGLGWRTLRMHGVDVRTPDAGEAALSVHLEEVEVALSAGFAPQRVHVRGGVVTLSGSPEALLERLSRRGVDGATISSETSTRPRVAVEGVQVDWSSPWGTLGARGMALQELEAGARTLDVESFSMQPAAGLLDYQIAGQTLHVELQERELQQMRLGALAVTRTHAPSAESGAPVGNPGVAESDSTLLDRLPDPAALRTRIVQLGARVRGVLRVGGEVHVASITASLGEGLRFGPAPLRVRHDAEQVRIELQPARLEADATRLGFRLDIPGDGAHDPELGFEGGPVSLASLGFVDGQLHLVGTAAARIEGKASVVFGDPLRAEGRIAVHDVGVVHPKLALDPVLGLGVEVEGRASLSSRPGFTLEQGKIRVGAARARVEMGLELHEGVLIGRGSLDVPRTPCETLKSSLPPGLLPRVSSMRFDGDFALRAELAFDARDFDALQLDSRVLDTCRVVAAPEEYLPAHFKRPFEHMVYSADGERRAEHTGPDTAHWTSLARISPFMQAAVLTSEDGAFFHHRGFSKNAIKRALIANLKAGRFRQGASTISMQLAKNLFLSRDKTLSRKLEELVLTDHLEQAFGKEAMMELYLNVIEFGPDVYGIGQAARHWFGREPEELNLAECMFLTSILPSPLKKAKLHEQTVLAGNARHVVDFLIRAAERTGKITRREMEEGLTQPVLFHHGGERPPPRDPVHGTRFEGDEPEEQGYVGGDP